MTFGRPVLPPEVMARTWRGTSVGERRVAVLRARLEARRQRGPVVALALGRADHERRARRLDDRAPLELRQARRHRVRRRAEAPDREARLVELAPVRQRDRDEVARRRTPSALVRPRQPVRPPVELPPRASLALAPDRDPPRLPLRPDRPSPARTTGIFSRGDGLESLSFQVHPRGASCKETIRLVTIFPRRRPRLPRPRRRPMDKRTTVAEAVAELRDGMTIGIGGWGSRRKPMALVREILRSPLRDLTRRELRRARRRAALRRRQAPQARLRLRLPRLDPARAALPQGAPGRRLRGEGARRGHAPMGPLRGGAPPALPADARRPRLRRDAHQPRAAHRALALRGRRGAGRDAGPPPRRRVRAHEPRRRPGERPVPRPRPLLRRPLPDGGEAALHDLRAPRRDPRPPEGRLLPHAAHPAPHGGRRDRDARTAPTSPSARRTTAATRPSRSATPTPRATTPPGASSARASSTSTRPTTSAPCARSARRRR